MDDLHTQTVHFEDNEVGEKASENAGIDAAVKKPGSKIPGRKRTKSGCLSELVNTSDATPKITNVVVACRKRRIKCGEERPTCQNCTKSKRQCEGYNQRVVFKDPMSAYRPSWSGTSQTTFASRRANQRSEGGGQPLASPPTIAPKPSELKSATSANNSAAAPLEFINEQPTSGTSQSYTFAHETFPPSKQAHFMTAENSDIFVTSPDAPLQIQPSKGETLMQTPAHYDFNNLTRLGTRADHVSPAELSPLDWSMLQSSSSQQPGNEIYREPYKRFLQPQRSATSWQVESVFVRNPAMNDQPTVDLDAQDLSSQQRSNRATLSSNVVPLGDEYDMMDDDEDPFDVSEDDLMADHDEETSDDPQYHHLQNNDLGVVVALQASQDDRGLQMRSIHDFIDRPNMLATYAPSMQSSPLRDPMAARLFCHFVNVTAPIISMYERHPANPSLIFQGQPIPKSQQHIWTCKSLGFLISIEFL